MQLFYTAGYAVFFVIAALSFKSLGPKFEMLIPYPSATLDSKFAFFSNSLGIKLDSVFYSAFGFVFVCFVGWVVMRIAGLYFKRLTYFPMTNDVNVLSGGILGLIVNYIGIFLILLLMALIPVAGLQDAMKHSFLASSIITSTPILTHNITNLWLSVL